MAKKTTRKKAGEKPSTKSTTRKKSSSSVAKKAKAGAGRAATSKKPASSTKSSAPPRAKAGVSTNGKSPKVKSSAADAGKSDKPVRKTNTTKKKPDTVKSAASNAASSQSSSTKKTTKSQSAAPPANAAATSNNNSKPARTKRGGGGTRKRKTLVATELTPADLTPDEDGYIVYKGRRVRAISTANIKKPVKKANSDEDDAAEKKKSAKPVKTKLKKADLEHYRDLLLIERAERIGDLSAMEAEALRSTAGNLSNMPIHMADIGSDVYEQDFMLGMAESERKLIREIDHALKRIEDGTYGVCQMTNKPIPKARLNAKPWAKYTIEAARLVESGQVG